MPFKDFLFLALAAILFSSAKPICSTLVEYIMGKIHVKLLQIQEMSF